MLRVAVVSVAFCVLALAPGGGSAPGGSIVFEAGRGVDGDGNLALVRPDGSDLHLLTHGDEDVSAVTWAADDRLAVDFAASAGDEEAPLFDSSGRRIRTIVPRAIGAEDPVWIHP